MKQSDGGLSSEPTSDGGVCGGFIFGCSRATEAECLVGLLFGMPAVLNFYLDSVLPEQPVFLFNLETRVRP